MLNQALQSSIAKSIAAATGQAVSKLQFVPVGGGCINHCYRLITEKKDFFLKVNSTFRYPGMFDAEARGLSLLRRANSLYIPEVVCNGNDGSQAFLAMEYIESKSKDESFWKNFGYGLAQLHYQSAENFGLKQDNYIGSLPQRNKPHDNWIDFFIEERLQPQITLANLSGTVLKQFESLFKQLPAVFPKEPPALLHGDLWSGNYLAGPHGESCLVDPAVYYGHREMDIAMSRLFGGFDHEFYNCYNEAWPMEPGWEGRLDICNLYPLLVHVNLFGGGYLAQAQSILRRFT